MSGDTSVMGLVLDDHGRVVDEISCPRCANPLREVLASEGCPACGLALTEFIRSEQLRHAPPAMTKRLAESASLIAIAAALFGGIMTLWLLSSIFQPGDWAQTFFRLFNVILFAAMIVPLVAVTGIMLLTRYSAAGIDPADFVRKPALTRAALWAAGLIALAIGGSFLHASFAPNLAMSAWIVAAPLAFAHYLERLMRLAPNPRMARRCRLVARACIVWACVVLAARVLSAVGGMDLRWEGAYAAITAIAVLVGIVVGCVWGALLYDIHLLMWKIARESAFNAQAVRDFAGALDLGAAPPATNGSPIPAAPARPPQHQR